MCSPAAPSPAARVPSLTFEELVGAGIPKVPDEPDEDEMLLMLYTGGTTGRSRGALGSNRQLVLSLQTGANVDGRLVQRCHDALSESALPHRGAQRRLCIPLRRQYRRAAAVLPPRADTPGCSRLSHHAPAGGRLGPTDDSGRTGLPAANFAALRYIIYGASPMPRRLLRTLTEAFPAAEIQESYGLTEAFGGVTYLSGPDHHRGEELLSSVGRALPGVILTVRDPVGVELSPGEVGELCISSGSATTQFWRDTDPAADRNWLHTGDLGRKDIQGYVYLVDRLKDMIKTGGENVNSNEIEEILARHPDVDRVAVIGIPDARWGEAVHAEVVPRPGSNVTAENIITFARRFLSAIKCPNRWRSETNRCQCRLSARYSSTSCDLPAWWAMRCSIRRQRIQPQLGLVTGSSVAGRTPAVSSVMVSFTG